MNRLDFQLNDFTRVAWAPSARETWEPRVKHLSNIYQKVERLAILEGVKPAALQVISPSEVIEISQWAAQNGIIMLPLERQGSVEGYSSSSNSYVEGRPFDYRVALTQKGSVELWLDAWRKSDNDRIGHALGYPSCCREFFQKFWVEEGMVDTTWPMSNNTKQRNRRTDGVIELSGEHPEANILLRWLGVRLVSHLPCSMYCLYSVEIARAILWTMKQWKMESEAAWIQEMLSWPIEWSALHGIAEIKTPVCRIITRTDATAEKLVVRVSGAQYPKEGASGGTFPYTEKKKPEVLQIQRNPTLDDDYEDNGFSTRISQSQAHTVILDLVRRVGLKNEDSVVDLGCGNGLLLAKVNKIYGCGVVGIDTDEVKLQKLLRVINGFAANWQIGYGYNKVTVRAANIYDWDWNSDRLKLAIISLNRFTEVDAKLFLELMKKFRANVDFLLVYTYNDMPTDRLSDSFEIVDNISVKTAQTRATLYRINSAEVLPDV